MAGATGGASIATRQGSLKYRADIDGLRAVAIVSVLIFHAFPSLLPGGYIGVDIFFVISGYLITSIILRGLQAGSFRFSTFYAHRIRRIFPALLLVLPVCWLAGWFFLLPEEFRQLGLHIAAGAGFLQNVVLWSEVGYFETASELKPLTHLWSLAIEEQFYLALPVLLWAAWKLRRRPWPALAVLAVSSLLSFALNVRNIPHDAVSTFFLPQYRAWELLAGGLLAYAQTRRSGQNPAPAWPAGLAHAASLAGATCLVAGLWLIRPDSLFPGWWALFPVAGAFLLIMAGAQAWVNRYVLANRLMVFIGLISYPLYLWHWPLLVFARIVEGQVPPWEIRLGAAALSVLLAWLTFRYVERPLRSGRGTWVRTAALAVLMVVMAGAGLFVHQRDGLPERLPGPVRAVLGHQYEYQADYREGSCFLRPEQDAQAFQACEDTVRPGAGRMLLWGDSHGAHLYPGLLRRYGADWTLVQRNASGCPPIPGMNIEDRGHCLGINEAVLQELRQAPPDVVILAAAWFRYDWPQVAQTIELLKRLGTPRIVVVGPVPQWQDGLPRTLLSYLRANGMTARLPERLHTGHDAETRELDREVAELVRAHGAEYASPLASLCDVDGCLVLSPAARADEAPSLTAWDYGHLTRGASEYVVRRFPEPEGSRVYF